MLLEKIRGMLIFLKIEHFGPYLSLFRPFLSHVNRFIRSRVNVQIVRKHPKWSILALFLTFSHYSVIQLSSFIVQPVRYLLIQARVLTTQTSEEEKKNQLRSSENWVLWAIFLPFFDLKDSSQFVHAFQSKCPKCHKKTLEIVNLGHIFDVFLV